MLHIVLYVLEVIRYALLYRLMFSKKIRRAWAVVVIGAALTGVFLFIAPGFSDHAKCIYAYIGTLVAMLIMMQESWKQRGTELLILFLTISVLTKVISVPVRLLEVYGVFQRNLNDYDSMLASMVTIMILGGMLIWRKRHGMKSSLDLSSTKIYVLVVIMIVGMLITASGLNVAIQFVPSRSFSALSVILVAVTYASIGVLGVFVVHIRKVNTKMEEMLYNETVLKEMQKSYYESLLEKEEDTRKYRHDMSNHLLCLNHFVKQQKTDELASYLEEMQEQLLQIQKKCYTTGNQVLDAITNYYLSQVDELVEVKVTGQVNEPLKIDNVTLCTIYSNLLKNAIEELERVGRRQKKLEIDFMQGEWFFQIEICNSLAKKSLEKETLLETEKADKRNHGLGLKNVKKAVRECGGELNFEMRDEKFCVKLILKNDRSRT